MLKFRQGFLDSIFSDQPPKFRGLVYVKDTSPLFPDTIGVAISTRNPNGEFWVLVGEPVLINEQHLVGLVADAMKKVYDECRSCVDDSASIPRSV